MSLDTANGTLEQLARLGGGAKLDVRLTEVHQRAGYGPVVAAVGSSLASDSATFKSRPDAIGVTAGATDRLSSKRSLSSTPVTQAPYKAAGKVPALTSFAALCLTILAIARRRLRLVLTDARRPNWVARRRNRWRLTPTFRPAA